MTKSYAAAFALLASIAGVALASACTIKSYDQAPTSAPPPTAAPAPTPAPSATTEPPAAYDPCGGKKCGDSCAVCAPTDANCVETAVVKQCSAELRCEASPAQCTTTQTPTYDSCAGKKCGDRCTLCAPGDLKCRESPLVKLCHANGQCKEATVADCQ